MSFSVFRFFSLRGLSFDEISFYLDFPMHILSVIFFAMILSINLAWARGEDHGFKDFWTSPDWTKVGKLILSGIIIWICVLFGLILLIIPGIYFALRFSFYAYAIMDKDLGPIDALSYSWKITKGHAWDLFVFNLYFGLWNMVGFFCLGIGLAWTLTMQSIASAKLYLELSAASDHSDFSGQATIKTED